MDFVEDFGAQINKYSYLSEHQNILCIRGPDELMTFNQCLSYLDSL